MAEISFGVSKRDFDLIGEIAERAVRAAWDFAGDRLDKTSLRMDITACHANGCPLKLAALRDADDFNFAHDVFGIHRHLDRETGKLMDCFLPRFAA